jgi:hypothetical protein
MEAFMASTFDMAIDHFWRTQQAAMNSNQLDCLGQMANGLQLFCGAVKGNNPDRVFDMAIDHFWRAQQAAMNSNQLECLGQMANGLQLFCGAVKK